MIRYNSYRSYIKKRFGKPVLKIPLNGGFNCPNRDGTKSFEGCHFCDNESFSPVAHNCLTPVEQLKAAISRACRFDTFIAYLQPFSNTYGTVELLKEVYEPLLAIDNVVGLAIGTRPDCFTDGVFRYLGELSNRTYLSIELGLQSSHDKTLEKVNRHHTFNDFTDAVKRLSDYKIETVAHVMLGLPGETKEMMMETARRLSSLPVTGVKIHQLMVIKGTMIQNWYVNGELKVLTLEEYAELLCGFLTFLRPDQHIHRIMADSRTESGLIAPMWSEDKSASVNFLHGYMEKTGMVQGRRIL